MTRPQAQHWHDQIAARERRVAESTDAHEINELGHAAEVACATAADTNERRAWAELSRFATKKLAQMGKMALVYEREES